MTRKFLLLVLVTLAPTSAYAQFGSFLEGFAEGQRRREEMELLRRQQERIERQSGIENPDLRRWEREQEERKWRAEEARRRQELEQQEAENRRRAAELAEQEVRLRQEQERLKEEEMRRKIREEVRAEMLREAAASNPPPSQTEKNLTKKKAN